MPSEFLTSLDWIEWPVLIEPLDPMPGQAHQPGSATELWPHNLRPFPGNALLAWRRRDRQHDPHLGLQTARNHLSSVIGST